MYTDLNSLGKGQYKNVKNKEQINKNLNINIKDKGFPHEQMV